MKTYKLKVDPEADCFMCHKKELVSFSLESLKFIQTLTLCRHHTETTKIAVKKFEEVRQPGEDDN